MEKYRDVRVAVLVAILGLNTFSSCVGTRQALGSNPLEIRPRAVFKSNLVVLPTNDPSTIVKHNLDEYEKTMKSACSGGFMASLIKSNSEKAKKRFARSSLNQDLSGKDETHCKLIDLFCKDENKNKIKSRFA